MSKLALVKTRSGTDLVRSRAAVGAHDPGRAVFRAGRASGVGAGTGPVAVQTRLLVGGAHDTGLTARVETATGRVAVQTRLLVGASHDRFEQEAERTADAVVEGRSPVPALPFGVLRLAQRAVAKEEPPGKDDEREKRVQKVPVGAGGAGVVPAWVEAGILGRLGGGSPLDLSLRTVFESRFGYDFAGVRVHTGPAAAGAASALGARAFTVGQDVFFGAGEYRPTSRAGQHLIAHELTHTIQQTPSGVRRARWLRASPRVQRWEGPIDRLRGKIANFLEHDFPPWELITLIIGRDPVRGRPVKASTRDWIHAAMKLAPDGQALFDRLDKEGRIDAVARWWDGEIARLDLTVDGVLALVRRAWDAVGAGDLADPVGAWNNKIKPIFAPTVQRVWTFVKNVAAKVFQVIRDVVLKQAGDWAKQQRGYPLLTMVFGRDPVTGEAVTPTLKGVIFAVLDLVPGGDRIKENLEKAKTVEKAAAWFRGEVKQLGLTWEGIRLLFSKAWNAFKITDLLDPVGLLEKMWAIFKQPVMRLMTFLLAVARKVLEFVFEGAMLLAGPVGVQILGIVRKAGSAFRTIVSDPVAFVRHLVDAVRKGVRQFGERIGDHLRNGVIGWLAGALEGAGLVLPKVWDLRGILDLTLQVLGITYPKIRVKLVKVLGEKPVAMLEKAFAFVRALVTEGPAAAWREIVAAVGSLWDLVVGGVRDWAVTKIVTAAVTKLATMFNPAGAVIQAIIAAYDTIAFFIERIKQILAFVEAVVDSLANIAAGKIAQAADHVEQAMARSIPVLLGFLARLIGLGDVSGAVKKVITSVQDKVDKAIDTAIAWIVAKAKQLFGVKDKDAPLEPGAVPETEFVDEEGGEKHRIGGRLEGGKLVATISSETQHLEEFIVEAKNDGRFDSKTKSPQLEAVEKSVKALESALEKLTTDQQDPQKAPAARSAVTTAEQAVSTALRELLSGVSAKEFDERYLLEGNVETYAGMPRQTFDELEADHQPQADLVAYVADLRYVDPATGTKKLLFAGKQVRRMASGRHVPGGITINLHKSRHRHPKAATYGRPVPEPVKDAAAKAANTTDTVEERQLAVIELVRKRLDVEVDAMLSVVRDPANYKDVEEWAKSKQKTPPLVAKLQARIEQGEEKVRRQDLVGWAS